MNNKGFAITTILYGMLILFLMLLMSLLGMLATYKDRLEKLIENTNGAREIINKAPAYNPCDTPDDEVPDEVNDCGASGVSDGIPEFEYTGKYEIVDDNDNVISEPSTWTCGWKIRFLETGTLKFTELKGDENKIDIFLVGGGANGASGSKKTKCSNGNGTCYKGGRGGNGGACVTKKSEEAITIQTNLEYSITIGNPTTNSSAEFGSIYTAISGGGASGGRGGGEASQNGSKGTDGSNECIEFSEITGRRYAGGGGGGGSVYSYNGSTREGGAGGTSGGGKGGTSQYLQGNKGEGTKGGNGKANTGGGGGGGGSGYKEPKLAGGTGGTGIVIIRNAR